MSDLNHSVAPQGTQSKRKTFPDMVREYVVPYNSLLAVATFVCLMFGYLSPFALTTFAVMLVTCVLQVIALNFVAKVQLAAWSRSHTGPIADITAAFWRGPDVSMYRTSPFWALLMITIAVVFFTIRTDVV